MISKIIFQNSIVICMSMFVRISSVPKNMLGQGLSFWDFCLSNLFFSCVCVCKSQIYLGKMKNKKKIGLSRSTIIKALNKKGMRLLAE